jgi:3-phenylpropionate/trans-cinnamate dioxygenase ferredoxin reductase subunit
MATSDTFVIVGAGLAGAKAAEALRDKGFGGQLVLLGTEPHRPYERPPLSKGYLMGSDERDSVFVHPEEWYAEHAVEFRPGTTVSRIDRAGHRVETDGGESVNYDKLLLATGSEPRRIPTPGADADGVLYLRTIDDSEAIGAAFKGVRRLAVVGAGWIGLEVTAAARAADIEVTVVEVAELPLVRVLGREVAEVFADLHRAHGVDFRFGASVSEITTRDGRASGLRLGDGEVVDADAVLVAVGAAPRTALAEECGLEVSNGVITDASLRTSDPDIVAVGDIANAYHPTLRRQVRVEHWANALNQPATAAATMLGEQAAYTELPYFYTDQYDLGMEYFGYVAPGEYDRVVFRGDVAAREFIAFWLAGGRVLAGMNVNVWDVGEPIKALINSGEPVDVDGLADPEQPLQP